MGVQNINFFEQHVEKIVLGVAAAGAVFMGYLAMEPISIPSTSGEPVTASNVEGELNTELQKVQAQMDRLDPNPRPTVPDYVGGYRALAVGQPLDSAVLVAGAAPFGPRNVPPGQSILPPTDDWKIVTPAPVGPETDDPAIVEKKPVEERLLRAQVLQVQVNTDEAPMANGAPIALPAGSVLRTRSVNVVVIDGYVPLGKMIKEMLTVPEAKSRVLPDLQKAEIYRIKVWRKDQPAGGSWSADWKEVPATKGSAAPVTISWNVDTDLVGRLADVDVGFKQIMLPDFYRKEDGTPLPPPILTRPLPPSIDKESTDLVRDIAAAKVGAVAGGVMPGMPGGVMPGQPAASAMLPTGADQIKVLPVVPFTFWDDTVLPDHKYQYKVQVQIVNPTYGSKLGLANPKMKGEPLLALEPAVVIPGTVVVHSDMAFFVQGTKGLGGTGIDMKIFKQDNGLWSGANCSVVVGGPVATQIKGVEVDTKFTLVDYQEYADKRGVHVILRDPAGNLVTREAPDDWKKAEHQQLEDRVKADAAAAAAAPGDVTTPVTIPQATPPAPTPSRATTVTPTPTPPPARGPATSPGRSPVLVNPGRGGTTRP